MNYYLFFVGVTLVLISFYPTLNYFKKKKIAKVSNFILYNTIGVPIDETNASFQTLKKFQHKDVTNNVTLELINKATSINKSFIWKGYIYGKLSFNNNDSGIIEISRYGAFFKNLDNNLVYSFREEADKTNWQKLIDDFLSTEYQ